METLIAFKASLSSQAPPDELSPQLKSLWYDGKGDWHRAHSLVDHLDDAASARVHAYLHRKEGDISNADYWYRRAQKTRPDISLNAEWEQLVNYFLG